MGNDDESECDCDEPQLGIDYYGALGLNRECTGEDVRRAFRRLSLRFHPERNQDAAQDTLQDDLRRKAFAVVAEAYDVLSDPLKRAVYEQYGEEGLKRGIRGPEAPVKPYVFHGEPMRTYREFFGTENPYADLLDNAANPLPLEDCPEARGEKKKDEPIVMPLALSLTEVFYGGVKKMKIQRLVLVGDDDDDDDDDKVERNKRRRTALEEKILSIPIMPGMPSGAKIVFPEEGDQGPTKIPADVVFVTEDKPHETFRRDGSNLRMTVDVFLNEALTGTIVTVNTIDDRTLRIPITSVISPDYQKTISGEGLPLVEDPEQRGDLIIDFNVEFPSYLSEASKSYVQKAFDVALDDRRDDNAGKKRGSRRIVLADKLYMRSDKLAQICRP
ncbi:dnaJ homolog subfamily B member 13 isoform X2 [Nasonia vitripennis]|uniref:J domain-containing protein n=1 Tax=Nasonia vitripennis TaxID=7425 RepID=A0A7M7G2Q1_NASVI|nr:dnaJ homolog subfamily B member 13 isoform X2 [Nasonia vitripennis]